MVRPGPILLAYDGECSLCRRMVDWVQRRDRWGLVVAFPYQNSELVQVAPELAGRPLHLEIHGVELSSRRVFVGSELVPHLLRRLPRWWLLAPFLRIPGISRLSRKLYLWIAVRRYRWTGRSPF